MKSGRVLVMAALWMAMARVAFPQGTTPTQPVDPTWQTPAGEVPANPPASPSTGRDTPAARTSAARGAARPFTGTVVRGQGGYVLRSGDLEYRLDDQVQAEPFGGKTVKVMGRLDRKSNTIRIETIELSGPPS